MCYLVFISALVISWALTKFQNRIDHRHEMASLMRSSNYPDDRDKDSGLEKWIAFLIIAIWVALTIAACFYLF